MTFNIAKMLRKLPRVLRTLYHRCPACPRINGVPKVGEWRTCECGTQTTTLE